MEDGSLDETRKIFNSIFGKTKGKNNPAKPARTFTCILYCSLNSYNYDLGYSSRLKKDWKLFSPDIGVVLAS